jgi:hypothetical protein
MALNKAVCIQCCKKNWPVAWATVSNDLNALESWGPSDVTLWESGEIICPIEDAIADWPHAKVDADPPGYCLCKFEQAVAAGVKNAK